MIRKRSFGCAISLHSNMMEKAPAAAAVTRAGAAVWPRARPNSERSLARPRRFAGCLRNEQESARKSSSPLPAIIESDSEGVMCSLVEIF